MPRRLPSSAILGAAALLALAVHVRPAHADEIDEGVRFKSIGVQGNPLGFVIGRYSIDLEYLPAAHHAAHVTAAYTYALPGVDDQLTGFGGEVGYRYYTGLYGPHGFFAGASFLVGAFEYIHGDPQNLPKNPSNDTQYVQLGGAIDVGYQLIFLGNFCLGAGVGVQYTADTTQPTFEFVDHPWHDLFYGWGLRPRALLQVGAAF
jgi:hypothetical protein